MKLLKVIKLSYKYIFASLIMFSACNLTKLIVNTGIASIMLQIGVGALVYGFILIRLKDEYIYMFLRKIYERFNP